MKSRNEGSEKETVIFQQKIAVNRYIEFWAFIHFNLYIYG